MAKVLDRSSHDSSRYIWEMSSVPFIIFSQQAKLRYQDLLINLKRDH